MWKIGKKLQLKQTLHPDCCIISTVGNVVYGTLTIEKDTSWLKFSGQKLKLTRCLLLRIATLQTTVTGILTQSKQRKKSCLSRGSARSMHIQLHMSSSKN